MSEDEFDPATAAARATGDLVDTDADDLEDVPDDAGAGDGADPTPDPDTDGDDSGGESTTSSAGSAGAVATFLLPLFVADEAGPTASTLRDEVGVGHTTAHLLDGGLDYVLHFSDTLGDQLGDSLGPAGKLGRGLSPLLDDAGADDQEDSDDAADAADDVGPSGLPSDAGV
ncbi:hypothetical protein [Halobacterium litoreum]|uniref:Uncharacterized protein n=1 Tax=Halobacterium litoreum TaxID=2039234 RepID=A0ABD5N827_9EURY|nr:hypothetical protein [Halobacterium litoreum]UHH14888.1 hypothetical protein LT972_14745 [Halobacterium litoreum]